MFTADLSWFDHTVEKVGERRERRGREAGNSVSTSTGSSKDAVQRPSTRKGSASFSSAKGSLRRPSTPATGRYMIKSSLAPIDANPPLKDPSQQPDWIYSAKLSTTLPSGAPLDPPPPHGSMSNRSSPARVNYSRQTNYIPEDSHKAWSVANQREAENICQSYEQVKDEILALQSPEALVPQNGAIFPYGEHELAGSEPSELPADEQQIPISPPKKNSRSLASQENMYKHDVLPPATPIEPTQELSPNFHPVNLVDGDKGPPPPMSPKTTKRMKTTPSRSHWEPPSSWAIVPTQTGSRESNSDPSPESSPNTKRDTIIPGTHFQRFVQRMESAGPKIILERLKEEWDGPADGSMSDELQLEKHLWALTVLQLQSMDRFARPSQSAPQMTPLPPISLSKRRKILELDGSIGEVYQLSAIYPNCKISHLTSTPQTSSIPLPAQASKHVIRIGSPADSILSGSLSSGAGLLPLPYANASMHHIRSARLASLLPAAQLPALLSECYRVLMPGGVLELRVMDATPERGSMGPKLSMWLEERLLLGLESEFRCQRPVMLVPRWAQDAGFKPLPARNEADAQGLREQRNSLGKLGLARCLLLPAAATESVNGSRDVVAQVGVLVCRALWKDAWGSFVHEDDCANWWWDSPEIVEECREWKTVWDVGTLFVVKEDKT